MADRSHRGRDPENEHLWKLLESFLEYDRRGVLVQLKKMGRNIMGRLEEMSAKVTEMQASHDRVEEFVTTKNAELLAIIEQKDVIIAELRAAGADPAKIEEIFKQLDDLHTDINDNIPTTPPVE